jgi:lactoylglutathione lyase
VGLLVCTHTRNTPDRESHYTGQVPVMGLIAALQDSYGRLGTVRVRQRQMVIEQIRSVAVVVSDEKKAKEWYRDRLGFEVQEDMEHWVVVGPPGSPTGIHLCKGETLEPGNTGILFYTENVEATYQELKGKGVEFTRELDKAEWDEKMKYAMFKDPDGNEFWLMPKVD